MEAHARRGINFNDTINVMKRRMIGLIRGGRYYDIEAGDKPPPYALHYGKAPAVYADTINKTYCDATGEVYESRAEMKRAIKEAGCESCDHSTRFRYTPKDNTKEWEESVAKAWNDLRNGEVNLSDEDRAICGEIDGRDKR